MSRKRPPTPVLVASIAAILQCVLCIMAIAILAYVQSKLELIMVVPWARYYSLTQFIIPFFAVGMLTALVGIFPFIWEILVAIKTKHHYKKMYLLWLCAALLWGAFFTLGHTVDIMYSSGM